MATKKKVRSLRVDSVLDARITAYAQAVGMKDSEAVRDLVEKGLTCEALSMFATPVGRLIRDVIEAEFNLMREEMDEHSNRLEEHVARVVSRGTKASLATQAQLNDVSRAVIPAWRDVPAADLWSHYSRMGGELQAGKSYADVKNGG